jgi:hypothetical protein
MSLESRRKKKQESSVSALSSSAANICGKCKKEVDEELIKTKIKKGRSRTEDEFCKVCHKKYMAESVKLTITMPRVLSLWAEETAHDEKANGYDSDISKIIRKGLELLRNK